MKLTGLLCSGSDTGGMLTNVTLAALRVFAGGSMAFAHGFSKFPVSDGFVSGVAHLGFPEPTIFAWCAALAEFAGGLLVAFGLITRPAALCVAFTMGVAVFMQHAADAYVKQELALLYFAIFTVFALLGAGSVSFDAALRSGSGGSSSPRPAPKSK